MAGRRSEADVIDAVIERRATAALSRFRHALVPLYSHKIGRPDLIGTGVALAVGSERILLTAAHVMRDFADDTLFISDGTGWVGLDGIAYSATTPGWKLPEDDRVDAAVFVINEKSRKHLAHCISPADLLPGSAAGPTDKFVLAGYPRSKLKYDFKRWKVTPRVMRFVGRCSPTSRYPEVDARTDVHIVLDFHREKSHQGGRLGAAPSVRGVSGGMLVWAPSITNPALAGSERIAAIFTEWPAPKRFLISTRIDVHLALIRNHLPHVATLVPEPKSVQFNLRGADERPNAHSS